MGLFEIVPKNPVGILLGRKEWCHPNSHVVRYASCIWLHTYGMQGMMPKHMERHREQFITLPSLRTWSTISWKQWRSWNKFRITH